ncbi:MAG: polysaccharide deacetylase family protein [Desulfobacterales bacterium]|nr:polysaccharide deacetylase family protein [Desulfobacterales bacterium]
MKKIQLKHFSKSISRCFFCLLLSAILSSCAIISGNRVYDDFAAIKVKPTDSMESLASEYLNDADKGWLIEDFNDIQTLTPGQRVIIPLKTYEFGGLKANGCQTVPVLAYTRFSKKKARKSIVKESEFEKQLNYLAENGYTIITMSQFLDFMAFKHQIPKKSVVITIDGGWRSFYDIAYPILKKYNMPVTIFIDTEFIGSKEALSWEQIKALETHGFDIQCMAKKHKQTAKLNNNKSFKDYFIALEKEISAPKITIQQELNKNCCCLAYNYEKADPLIMALLAKLDYQAVFTSNSGSNPFYISNYRIHRNFISGKYSFKTFKRKLSVFKEMDLK